MSLLDCVKVPRKVLPIIFIVETSSEMQGAMIGAVNIFLSETLPMFLDFEQENKVDVKINVLSYSTGAKWMYGEMINASDFEYRDLIANGNVEMGAAFEALDEALSCGIIGDPFAIYTPYYILFSANSPTDDYQTALSKLKANNLFRGVNLGIAIGNNANKNILKEFTGHAEGVLEVHQLSAHFPELFRLYDEQMDLPAISIHHHIEWWNNLELNWKIILLSNYCFNRIGWNLNDCNIECFAFQGNIEEDLIGFAVWAGGGDDFDFKENIENISYSILNSIVYETKILWCAGAKVESIEPIRKLFQLEDVQGLIYRINKMELEMKSIPKNKLTNTSDDETLSKNSNIPDFNDDGWV